MSQKNDLQFSVPEGQEFDMSLIIEISDKILHLQLILSLIPTAYTHLIVKFVI